MSESVKLQEVEIFTDLSPSEIGEIEGQLRQRRLKKDEILFNEGDEGQELFIVESGKLGVSVRTKDGTDLDVAEFGPGDFFGEMSIFEQEPRSATCYTKSASVLQSLHESNLLSLIENDPVPAMKIMRRMLSITRSRLDNTGSFLTEMVQWGEAARKRSITDELTGFFNRRYLDEALPSLIQAARDEKKQLCVCMLDLDHFRQINEQISHAVGDEIIKKAVSILKDVLLPTDTPVRYGGDEFVILMPETAPEDGAKRAENVRKGLNELDLLKDYECSVKQVTTSIGLACFPDHAKNVAGLKEAADQALYRAKEEGRNRVNVYTKEGE
jgi:diguanylate cyclase (GGDEF)-like protein